VKLLAHLVTFNLVCYIQVHLKSWGNGTGNPLDIMDMS